MIAGTSTPLDRVLAGEGVRRLLEQACAIAGSAVEIRDLSGRCAGRFGGAASGGPVSAAIYVFGSRIGDATAWRGDAPLAEHVACLVGEILARERDLDDLSREILDAYEEVNLFYDVSRSLPAAGGVRPLCRVLLEGVCRIIPARRASILLLDGEGRELRLAAAIGIEEREWDAVRMSVGCGVSGRVLKSRQPMLVDDVRDLPRGLLAGYERYVTRSFISVPLNLAPSGACREGARVGDGEGRAIGVINLADRADGRDFSSGDLKLLCALGNQAAVLVQNVRLMEVEREHHLATRIQRSLLPEEAPRVEGADAAGVVVPASGVGGDYYDFVPRDRGRELAVAVADVSGHGVASALLMAVARTVLRNGMKQSDGPADALAALNRQLFEDLARAEHFLSAFCAFYVPATGLLRYASAGHPPALLVRAGGGDGSLELLAADGMVAGIDSGADYGEGCATLGPGDCVYVCTDGVLEATGHGGDRFGRARLARAAEAAAVNSAAVAATEVIDAVRAFARTDGIRDDVTVVALKVPLARTDKEVGPGGRSR